MFEIKLDSSLFSKDAIFKCLYWYTNSFVIDITSQEDGFFLIKLELKIELEESELVLLKAKINQDLIDFNLRDIVSKETQNLRDLLIAKAFSNGEFDENPPGEYTDPVGFKL